MSEKIQERVKLPEKLGFLAFSTSSNIVFNFKSLYYMTFLKMILQVPVFWATVITTIGTIWDAINDPLIGFWSVNHKFKNGEKIRPLALYFAVPWAISIILMFCDFGLSTPLTVALCILIYIVFEAFYTFLCIPYNSMGALATNNDEDRRSINSFRSLGGCLGSGIGAVCVPIIVKQVFGGLKNSDIYTSEDAKALLLTACVMACVCIIGCLAHYFTSKERVKQKVDNEDKISFKDTFKMLFSIKSWVYNMLYILCYGITTALVMNEINDYAAYILGDSSKVTGVLVFYLVVAILTAIFIGALDKKIGHKNTMIVACLGQVIGRIPFIFAPYSMFGICLNAAATGFGGTLAFIMFNTNRNNVADIVEFKFGKRVDSMVATCDNLITKLAEALAVFLMGLSLTFAGYNAELGVNQPEAAKMTIIALVGLVPALISLIQAFIATKADVLAEYKVEQEKAK